MPLLEHTSALLHVLNGERSLAKRVEEFRFELHEGRKILRFGSSNRSADVHGDFSTRDKSWIVPFPNELHPFGYALRGESRHRTGRIYRKRTSRSSAGDLATDFFECLSGQGILNGLAFLDSATNAAHANQDSLLLTPPFRRLLEFKEKSTLYF